MDLANNHESISDAPSLSLLVSTLHAKEKQSKMKNKIKKKNILTAFRSHGCGSLELNECKQMDSMDYYTDIQM